MKLSLRAARPALALAVLAACTHGRDAKIGPEALKTEGGAAYSTKLLEGEKGPSNRKGEPATPKVTADYKAAPPTNDWWSSLIWNFDGDPYSRTMFPHPLAMRADAEGLGVSYPKEAKIESRGYRFPYERDLRIGVDGLKAPDARVARSSDWAVTARWTDGARTLEATMGHGLPFVYARVRGGAAKVDLAGEATPWGGKGEVLGITVRGHDYGLFAPTGATWEKRGSAYVSDLAGKGFFSVAALPDHAPETLETFRKHAYAFVDDTRVSWSYAPQGAKVASKFEVKTTLVEPGAGRVDAPILALYPHQWKASKATFLAPTYVSARGPMKILEGGSFEVERTFHGIVPILPDSDEARSRSRSYLKDEAGAPVFKPGLEGVEDTYWAGKSLGRAATMAWIARQIGEPGVEEHMREAMTRELEDWFDGQPPKRFVYDATWRTLIGFPSGYQSGTELNDHHFHYGYFLWAAATLAALDPASPAATRWAPFVRMLADDVADPKADDPRFPRLRSFDAYAGHSWASGAAMFDDGNNEESSSEDANFAAGLALWGMVTGDDAARDRGIFLYETLVSAVEQYWLDVDHDVFPKGYKHPVAGIVWGDGARYDTWWSREATYVHGINVLPITGASLYLGRHPEAIHADLEHLLAENHGPVHLWRDVMWMYEALDDAPRAAATMDDEHYFDPEYGSSWAWALYWTYALKDFGRVDPSVVADHPGFAVFHGPQGRTYAAFNPTGAPTKVAFSDGATLDVAPRSLAHVTRPQH